MRQAHEGQHPLSLPLSYTIMAVWLATAILPCIFRVT